MKWLYCCGQAHTRIVAQLQTRKRFSVPETQVLPPLSLMLLYLALRKEPALQKFKRRAIIAPDL